MKANANKTPASLTLTTSIPRPADDVYDFIRDPSNLPKWATSFCQSIKNVGGKWIMETPIGPHEIDMVKGNAYRVADHYVKPVDADTETYVPMRVIPNGEEASEVTFTLNQTPDMSDARFADDSEMVRRDLATLKKVLEG
jgi:uncharacterized protein YndB with AHSA1/START domain